jgi:hypothetical protein
LFFCRDNGLAAIEKEKLRIAKKDKRERDETIVFGLVAKMTITIPATIKWWRGRESI